MAGRWQHGTEGNCNASSKRKPQVKVFDQWYWWVKNSTWHWYKASGNRCYQRNKVGTQGGTTKSTFALGDKDSSILRDRGSTFKASWSFT